MARTDPKFMLRMPPDLKARVEEAARANNRSMNAEIVSRLETSFAEGFHSTLRAIAELAAAEAAVAAAERAIQRLLREERLYNKAVRRRRPPSD